MTTSTNSLGMSGDSILTPYLGVADADSAIAFYQKVFGAREDMRLNHPQSGKIVHAQISIRGQLLMLADAYPEQVKSPHLLGGTSIRLCLRVDDVDATVERALEEGSVVLKEAMDEFYGQRSATIRDPFGHEWMLQHVIEEVKPAELQRRFNEMVQ
jgi:PhnB protein